MYESSRGGDGPIRIFFSSVVVVVACVGDGSDGSVSLEVYASLEDCFAEEMEDEFVGMEMGCWVGEAGFCGVDFGELRGVLERGGISIVLSRERNQKISKMDKGLSLFPFFFFLFFFITFLR